MNLHIQDKLDIRDYLGLSIWAVFISRDSTYINPMQVFVRWKHNTLEDNNVLEFVYHEDKTLAGKVIEVTPEITVCLAESYYMLMKQPPVRDFLNSTRCYYDEIKKYREDNELNGNLFILDKEEESVIDYESEIIYD